MRRGPLIYWHWQIWAARFSSGSWTWAKLRSKRNAIKICCSTHCHSMPREISLRCLNPLRNFASYASTRWTVEFIYIYKFIRKIYRTMFNFFSGSIYWINAHFLFPGNNSRPAHSLTQSHCALELHFFLVSNSTQDEIHRCRVECASELKAPARKHVSLLRPHHSSFIQAAAAALANVYKTGWPSAARQYASQCARDYNQHTRCTERQLFLIGQKRRVIFLLVASKFAL